MSNTDLLIEVGGRKVAKGVAIAAIAANEAELLRQKRIAERQYNEAQAEMRRATDELGRINSELANIEHAKGLLR